MKKRNLILAVLVLGAAAGGYKAWRYVSIPNHSCLLPTATASTAAVEIGSSTSPLSFVGGQVARLDRVENPIKFAPVPIVANAHWVHYVGGLHNRVVVPDRGGVKSVTVNGKTMSVHDGSIERGCIDITGLGPSIVLFSHGPVPQMTLVLTDKQIDKVR